MEVLREGRKDIHFFKENKYAFKCGVCGAVFIVDEHEFHGGYWRTGNDSAYTRNANGVAPACIFNPEKVKVKHTIPNIEERSND